MHLFLAPHCDDAALSCGGQIAQLTKRGERVVIFTVMAGDPPFDFKQTPFTETLHTRWGFNGDPMAGRRGEDEAAARVLGADIKFGPYPDAVYRTDPQTGIALYDSESAIFGTVQPADPVLMTRRAAVVQAIFKLFEMGPGDVIHAPLGIGKHIDHQVVHDMGKALVRWRPNSPLYFYEDYPYAARQGEAGVKALLASLDMELVPQIHTLDPVAIDARLNAIQCYKSQLSSLNWDSSVTMAREVRTHIAQRGGEREWRLLYVPDSPLS
jgi:LmbE family N-acetylglucosaminyl deacetylase